jgi:hypothetical protein
MTRLNQSDLTIVTVPIASSMAGQEAAGYEGLQYFLILSFHITSRILYFPLPAANPNQQCLPTTSRRPQHAKLPFH